MAYTGISILDFQISFSISQSAILWSSDPHSSSQSRFRPCKTGLSCCSQNPKSRTPVFSMPSTNTTPASGPGLPATQSLPPAHRSALPCSRARIKNSFGVAQDGRYAASAVTAYRTETVTPFWLVFPPIDTVIGRGPDCAFDGIWTLSCITPATRPGASPAYT